MTEFPDGIVLPLHIASFSRHSVGPMMGIFAPGNTQSGGWPTNNKAIFVPFALPWPYPVQRMFCVNGGTVTGTIDLGIYSESGVRIWHAGSTTQAGASSRQYITPSPVFILPPGAYYFAMSASTAGASVHKWNIGTTNERMIGLLQQLTAHPLPATMTGVTVTTTNFVPNIGITRTESGF